MTNLKEAVGQMPKQGAGEGPEREKQKQPDQNIIKKDKTRYKTRYCHTLVSQHHKTQSLQ